MRGEYPARPSNKGVPGELPPRARRIQAGLLKPQLKRGTTSACAENTACQNRGRRCVGNYLRVRGEYHTPRVGGGVPPELPPRARRIRQAMVKPHPTAGTTSACAENTRYQPHPFFHAGNYLRVRGEYELVGEYCELAKELPPRARRILMRTSKCTINLGTTSACAENTTPGQPQILISWNYLRVRGEYWLFDGLDYNPRELPPRARRIRRHHFLFPALSGTTSACAENTCGVCKNIRNTRNYLRVRGEY